VLITVARQLRPGTVRNGVMVPAAGIEPATP
jgi:hypothetical protein